MLLSVCFKIFEQFVKTRIKEEYKEKRSKLLLAKEEFKKLLEESKVSPRYGEGSARGSLGLEARLWSQGPRSLPVQSGDLTCQGPRRLTVKTVTFLSHRGVTLPGLSVPCPPAVSSPHIGRPRTWAAHQQ